MRKYLIIIALSLVSVALSARDVKVSVVMSKTSYAVAESETGGAGKAWTAVANLAGLPYETLFVEDLTEKKVDESSLLVLSQCLYLTGDEYALVDRAVRRMVEAGKGVVVDGPVGLYDQDEEVRKDRPVDKYLGINYQFDAPVEGFRLRVADNDHFITGPYHMDQALSNLLAESLPVLTVTGGRTLVNVTDDIQTYPYISVLKKGEGKVAVLDGLSAKACISASFKNYNPKGFFPSEVYPTLTRLFQWCQWGDVNTPFPSLLLSDGGMTAIIRLDGDGSISAPSMVQCMDYLIDLANETGVQSVFSYVSAWAERSGWHFYVDRARQMQEQGSVIGTHTKDHRLDGLKTDEQFSEQLDGTKKQIREAHIARGYDTGEIRYLINPGNTLAMHNYHQVAKRFDMFMTHGLDQFLDVTYGNMTWFTGGIQLPVIGDSPSPDYQWFYDSTWSHTTPEIANYQNLILNHFCSGIGNGVVFDLMWHDYGMSNIEYAGPRFIRRVKDEGTRIINDNNWELYETTRNFWATHDIYCPEPEELVAKMKFLSNAAYEWRCEDGALVMDIRFDAENFGKYAKYIGGMAVGVNNTGKPIRRVEIDGKPHAAFSDTKVILPCPADSKMTVKVFFDGAPAPRLEYTSKILKSIANTAAGLEAEVVDHSVARMKFRLTEPSVVLGASSYTVAHDGETVECRMEGSGTVTLASNPTPVRITSSTLPVVKIQASGKGAKVTLKGNGKRHNKLVYSDASGNRIVKEIESFKGEKTFAL